MACGLRGGRHHINAHPIHPAPPRPPLLHPALPSLTSHPLHQQPKSLWLSRHTHQSCDIIWEPQPNRWGRTVALTSIVCFLLSRHIFLSQCGGSARGWGAGGGGHRHSGGLSYEASSLVCFCNLVSLTQKTCNCGKKRSLVNAEISKLTLKLPHKHHTPWIGRVSSV